MDYIRILLLLLSLGLLSSSCDSSQDQSASETQASTYAAQGSTSQASEPDTLTPVEEPINTEEEVFFKEDTSQLAQSLIERGLVNIADLNPNIEVRMMYSTPDNFLQADVYGAFCSCFLQPEVAEKLNKAEQLLEEKQPDLRLIVFDCVRPRSVQFQMWEIVKGTDQQNYVAPPTGGGSMHNYGAAVDLGLYHIDSGLVDMGTPFDFFGELAQPRHEQKFLASGDLTPAQQNNRSILRVAMKGAGFNGILSEWWHFNGFGRKEVRSRYTLVE